MSEQSKQGTMLITANHLPNPIDRARLADLAGFLSRTHNTIRYVDYSQAERDCEQLAVSIQRVYSRAELRGFSFAAIPRGGLIVLGMLSYFLDLDPSQLQPDFGSLTALFVVDDCSLTGMRFSRFIQRTASTRIVFAHLYSHPSLRQAIVVSESSVEHCIAAHDLVDHLPEYYPLPAEREAWQKRRRERLGANRYWCGLTDLVCFAWSEPDRVFWNAVTQRMEHGWRFLPPQSCLKNRASLRLPVIYEPARQWRAPTAVAYGQFDDALWLCQLTTEQVYLLRGVAADIWRAMAAYGSCSATINFLLQEYNVDEIALRQDVNAFVKQLVENGLLEPVNDAPDADCIAK